jgi:tetratricopeptide (TPR) repeat protein
VWRKLPGIMEDRLAWTLSALGQLLSLKGKYAEAEAALLESLDIRRRLDGEPFVGESLGGLASLYQRSGRMAEAEKYFRMNLAVLQKIPRLPRSQLAYGETGLGRFLTERGRADEAEPLLRHALDGLRQELPADHPRIAYAEVLLGDWLTRRRRFEEAQPLLERGVKILRAKERGSEQTAYAEARLAALTAAIKTPGSR